MQIQMNFRSLLLKMSLLSMKVFGYALQQELIPANQRMKDYEELAISVMSIVYCLVHKTKEKIESSTDVLKEILKPVVDEVEEVRWPPRDPKALKLMEKEINPREQEGQLDEGFLSEVNAQLRQAKEDVDKPGLEAMLQKVLQLYASRVLSKRSYAKKVWRGLQKSIGIGEMERHLRPAPLSDSNHQKICIPQLVVHC
ncbi:uncharacterized protein LOC126706469 [Quercus robur]|uniref:uncharacterized protein LOC126706469 n=1 Tax=Quercus robur TaxID=38942 RepID=UPI002161BA9F|nr:uncharacterized protein LOC126706469 [Quercus robur]XP_050261912.1 uncharacterized protein LOC126706469 [Quercus robur]